MHRGFNGHCTGGGGKFFNGGPVCVGESKVMQIAAADEEGSPALTSSPKNGQYIMYYIILYFLLNSFIFIQIAAADKEGSAALTSSSNNGQ